MDNNAWQWLIVIPVLALSCALLARRVWQFAHANPQQGCGTGCGSGNCPTRPTTGIAESNDWTGKATADPRSPKVDRLPLVTLNLGRISAEKTQMQGVVTPPHS